MADNKRINGVNNNAAGGYPPYGTPNNQFYNQPNNGNRNNQFYNQPNNGNRNNQYPNPNNLTPQQRAARLEQQRIMKARQQRALENSVYRNKIEAIDKSRGGIDRTAYRLAEDRKKRKEKDYFYVMRRFICFILFIVLLTNLAFIALSFIKIPAIPEKYLSLFVKGETVNEVYINTYQSIADPIYGFIKNISGKLGYEISLGDSSFYNEMLIKSEGMSDAVGKIVLEYFPIALIIYILTSLILIIKAFLGMFGKRIFKGFGLGSVIMIISVTIVLLGVVAYITEINATISYINALYVFIIALVLSIITDLGSGGFALIFFILVAISVLFWSMFARKKVPYSIFDN